MQSSINEPCWRCGYQNSLNDLTLNPNNEEYECTNAAICRDYLQSKCDMLKRIAADLHWMARRYADGRSTYAPGMVNDAVRQLLRFKVELREGFDKTIWARDGMGPGYSDLTEEEYNMGIPIEEWSRMVIPEEMQLMATELHNLRQRHAMLTEAMDKSIRDREVWLQQAKDDERNRLAELLEGFQADDLTVKGNNLIYATWIKAQAK